MACSNVADLQLDHPAVIRSPYAPPGKMWALRHADGTATVILPPEASDQVLVQTAEAVETANDFTRAMNAILARVDALPEVAELRQRILDMAPPAS